MTICIFRQTCKAVCPVSRCISTDCLALVELSICQQIYSDAAWTFSILVIVIIPGLCSADFCCFRYMTVGDVHSIHICSIPGNSLFLHAVCDLLTILIYRQLSKAVLPAIFFSDCHTLICYITILQQRYLDALRSLSILVVIVVPSLRATYFRCLWFAIFSICNNISILIISYCVFFTI